ncbi:malonate-semialdehyde dehydrogenase (acetylating)/methylmalonate-semialdehyde dehydrogenase [Paenibacillus sp. V4I3]|uniref:CoA-acylating methylmalonate-semialdehyde dehydrogenase n=1 Tax=unclassified Paenibacillus TaxID=185978 RepID=UPI00277E4512|nr:MULTISPECIES: CoA-acylating methylmalonate-semialdehyde dehydrogenase [unclassified Paenibacillus]MDQ0876313.1 malonate-semialdehyde dehydrogenase (acetylating)/methylmalonate-semialdehyde dehydrogenase [Paenibacillus sp. V4I3]MDQ0887655.1 malonate-semialdehyde dehydrogenase (acetylating)/methylmalonate-semialdehyde dehydrogenase [Paenibacillus sp. V4I9]
MKLLQNFVNGVWIDSESDAMSDVINPATGEIIARVPLSSSEDVEAAVLAAQTAFESWSRTPVPKRARVLFHYWQLLQEHEQELAELITSENGKSYKEALGEVLRGIECVEFAAGTPSHMMGSTLANISADMDSELFRVPLGVVGGITPFNFPMMVPCWMFPLAIACGNTFVLKPSERTPLTAMKLAALFQEAGLPDGVLNIVHGSHDVVNTLTTTPAVKAISFVGSQPVAKYVYEKASSAGKRVQALAGAKNYHIVMPDAHVEKTIENIIMSSFGSAGERCMACSAIVVVGDGDNFVNRLHHEARNMVLGNGMKEEVTLTPLIRSEQRTRIEAFIDKGIEEGAELLLDGRDAEARSTEGFFLGATVFDHVKPNMTIAKEEIFGPVLSLFRAEDLDEALLLVNQSRFGNSAVIYTENAKAVRKFREGVEAGMLGVNVGVPAPMAFFPFSGWKDSFYGDLHANGKDGVEFYTKKKMITSRYF